MNKKQWFALGFYFMLFAMLASHSIEAMYEFLAMVCGIVGIACFICGWLEKEWA